MIEKYNFDINQKAHSMQTCLMITANHGYMGLVKYLVEKGSRLDDQDNTGFTALTYSVKMEQIPIAIYLISKGSNIKI